jgi:hypothetical protein
VEENLSGRLLPLSELHDFKGHRGVFPKSH